VNGGLRTGWSCLSRRFIPMGFFMVLLCGFILVGQTHAQEVIVAREAKPEPPKQAAPPPEQTPAESATPEPEQPKRKSRSKRSTSAEPTLEEMRNAGAIAAERLSNPSPSQTRKSGRSDSEAAPTPGPTVPETPRPARKETRSEPTSTSHRPTTQTTKPVPSGAVRPTLMESGRSEPSTTPLPKDQTPAP
jgi:hypothetical protein